MMPDVWVSTSRIVTGRLTGTRYFRGGGGGDPGAGGASAGVCGVDVLTCTLANAGTNREMGSVSRILPASTSIRIETAVTGFVIEAMRKMVSLRIGACVSRFDTPRACRYS